MKKLSDTEFREEAIKEISEKESYPDFSEKHIEEETKRLKAQDKWF